MTKRIHIVAFGMALLLATSIVSASAFTTATVERDADVAVKIDSSAVIKIEPGTHSGISESSDVLQINLDDLNRDSDFDFGQPSTAESTYAFKITNNDGSKSHDFEAKYEMPSDPATGTAHVTFDVYNSNDNSQASFSEEDFSSGFTPMGTFSDGETKYVLLSINTADMSTSNTYTGTLTIHATPASN
jgi:hypothetical protein